MVTKTKIRERVKRLQDMGYDIEVGWAYGRPRITNKTESRDLSRRLPIGQLINWIEGFEACLEQIERNRGLSLKNQQV